MSMLVKAGLGVLAMSSIVQGTNSSVCSKGLYMIVARGSNEPAGVGRIGVVAGNVSELIPGSTIEALDYPASYDNYLASEVNGLAVMTEQITSYVKKCPGGKIALVGWSQVREGSHLRCPYFEDLAA